MGWNDFVYYAVPAMVLWNLGAVCAQKRVKNSLIIHGVILGGLLVFALYIAFVWIALGRPPMRTMGETRLWYSFILALVGYLIFLKWRFPPLLLYSSFMASVFATINIFKPEIFDQTLMPALQSVWFIPHVAIYMLAYGVMGAVFITVCYISLKSEYNKPLTPMIRALVDCGIGLLIIGMLTGAIWAKEAWGTFWGWDVKECWALITVFVYCVFIHIGKGRKETTTNQRWVVVIGFLALQICWYGVKFLPTAASSVHTYS